MFAFANAAAVLVRAWVGVAVLALRPVEADGLAVGRSVLQLALPLALASAFLLVAVATVAESQDFLRRSARLTVALDRLEELLLFGLLLQPGPLGLRDHRCGRGVLRGPGLGSGLLERSRRGDGTEKALQK